MLGLAVPVLAGAVFVILHGAAVLGAPVPPLPQVDVDQPFEWKDLAILAGCLVLGSALARYGGGYLVGIVLPAVEIAATVDRRQVIRGSRGRSYTVTIGGVTSDASRQLYEAVREGDPVRVKRLRGSREIIRVVRAD